jgi:transposase
LIANFGFFLCEFCAEFRLFCLFLRKFFVIMITSFDMGRIQAVLDMTNSISQTAGITGFSRKTVRTAIRRKFVAAKRKRSENPKNAKRLRTLAALARRTRRKQHRTWPAFSSAKQLAAALFKETGELLSARQVQRLLGKSGLGWKPYVRKHLTSKSRVDLQKRRAFAEKHRNIEWQRIVFSDESWLCCNERTGRLQWAEKKQDVLGMERKARWNVPSIMVWGCVGYNFKGPLIVFPSKMQRDGELRQFRLDADSYVRRCLSAVVPRLVREKRIFQQDGARSHAAKRTMEYLQSKKVEVLADWPPYSPDLNAIERIWKELNARVGARCPMSAQELTRVALEEWEALPQELINAHCAHLPTQLAGL